MGKTPRTFKVDSPHMKGDDIKQWEHLVKRRFDEMDIACPIDADGVYDVADRSFAASLLHALGINATEAMREGITPDLRTKVRNRRLSDSELKAYESQDLVRYRRALRTRWLEATKPQVHRPVATILSDSWGFHPGVHDGVDVICKPDAIIYAMIKAKVIDVRSSGWWGLGAPSNAALKAKGDGIIQLEVLESVGPFFKGQHIGYGHAEKARVKVGQTVAAGEPIGHAGFANAWHVHLMLNNGQVGKKGVGTNNPQGILDYSINHG